MSPAEVEAAARDAVTSVADELGALTQPLFESALAYDADGPLGGVPFVIKDSGPFARGVSFAFGSRAIRGVADQDHELMRRFRRAGLAAIGQTCAPELSLSFATESRLHGVTGNPWNLGAGRGRLERGSCGARGSGCGSGRARERRCRVDPNPCRVLRRGGAQAEPGQGRRQVPNCSGESRWGWISR